VESALYFLKVFTWRLFRYSFAGVIIVYVRLIGRSEKIRAIIARYSGEEFLSFQGNFPIRLEVVSCLVLFVLTLSGLLCVDFSHSIASYLSGCLSPSIILTL
jgi:hypothetical protein